LAIGRESKVTFATGITVASTSSLEALFIAVSGSNVSALAKNITITPPETAHDLQSFLSVDTNDFQNQMLEEKPPGLATFTATMILDEDESLEPFLTSGATTVTGGYTRYQTGKSAGPDTDILVNISGSTAGSSGVVNLALIDSKITKFGDVKVSGPDGHWEQDVTATCLAKNFYWEYKD